MSIIHINQIRNKISEIFMDKIDFSDIGENDQQKEDKRITRCLAAYAVYNTIECSPEDAANSVVDGGDDNGIDAIYYSSLNKRVVIVQSKWSNDGLGEPDSSGVAKFCTGVRDLFNLNFDRFNAKMLKKRKELEIALGEYDTKYYLVFIDTCTANQLAVHSTRHIEDLLTEMNNTGDENAEKLVSFKRLNQGKTHSSLALSAGNDPIDLELGLSNWGMVSEPYKAYYGMVSGKEIVEWWKQYNMRLFEKNIRQVLGKTDVNDEIQKTLIDTPELFWYFNNGITLIANKITKSIVGGGNRDIGSFKLEDIAIVNGAQTVSSIGKFGIDEDNFPNLENVKISLRMIQLQEAPENFDKEITKTNNRQNRIENRDFVSQDPEQLRIKTELLIDGIDYHIMRSENFKYGEKSFDLIEATASLACSSGKTNLAVQAKGGIGKFFENLDKGIYKELFNPSVSGYYVYNSVKVSRKISAIVQEEIEKLDRYSGRDYGLLIHGIRIITLLTIQKLNLKPQLSNINFEITDDQLKSKVIECISQMTEFLTNNYPDSIIGTLFKNSTKCNEMTSHILG